MMLSMSDNQTGLMRVVCCMCKRDMGVKPCEPHLDGEVSHGVCKKCEPQLRKDMGLKSRRRGRRA